MRLKNYQEDVVLRAVEIALEEQPEQLSDESFVNDVAAYVLNRIPPRYVMSERGFLRLALEHLDDDEHDRSLANVIELMLLVNRGIELVRSRRTEPSISRDAARDEGLAAAPGVEYLHNYPQIIGKIVDSETGEPVFGAKVTMHIDGDLVPPAANGWQNPCVTQEQTRGHFSFWPRSTRSVEQKLSAEVLFTVEHPDYAGFRSVARIETEGEFGPQQTIRGDKIVSLAPFALVSAAALSSEES